MTNKLILVITITFLAFSCKKKESTPISNLPQSSDNSKYLIFVKSVGNYGGSLDNLNLGYTSSNTCLATDGNYIYIADYDNHCVKKVDLSTNSIIGCYGFENGVWGYYTSTIINPKSSFKPKYLVFQNNKLYAFSSFGTSSKQYNTKVYKFDVSGSPALDSNNMIQEFQDYSPTIDHNENIIIGYNDSIKVYSNNIVIRKFGGTGSGNGKFQNQSFFNKIDISFDTLIIADVGNLRIQKITTSGDFISTFNSTKSVSSFFINDNKFYYNQDNNKFTECYSNGNVINEYLYKDLSTHFGAQFVVIGNKVVLLDYYNNKLDIYTK